MLSGLSYSLYIGWDLQPYKLNNEYSKKILSNLKLDKQFQITHLATIILDPC